MNYYIGKDVGKKVLNHYGVIGMKWGVRRFQNEDGSLTEAGKERYVSRSTAKYEKKAAKALATGNEKAAHKWEKRARNSRELDKYEEQIYKSKIGGENYAQKALYNLGSFSASNSYRRLLALHQADKGGKELTKLDKASAFVEHMLAGPLSVMAASKLYEYTNDPEKS